MRITRNILAVLALAVVTPAVAEPESMPVDQGVETMEKKNFQSYRTRLRLRCNGVEIGESRQNVVRGDSVGSELGGVSNVSGSCGAQGKLRLYQRVTSFPPAPTDMALLQVELFSDEGDSSRRVIAPTFGVRLGEEKVYLVKSEWGDFSIEATVNGAERTSEAATSGPHGIAYPGL